MTEFKISPILTQKVWEKLNQTAVPIVEPNHFMNLSNIVEDLNDRIRSNQYMPDNAYGYLGVEKKYGVSRFLPIINHTDMAVYYQICGEIGDSAIENIDGVFGGWQVVPTPASRSYIEKLPRNEQVALLYSQEYFSETFSAAAWFQNYKSFTEYLRDTLQSGEFGNYVGITDIANFYDSISVDNLIHKIKAKLPRLNSHTDILELYLNYWNRRIIGYKRSNKGIPQEIISDGSRNLSHFYLHEFDRRIISYCSKMGVKYVRWADDMLFFARSTERIEKCLYEASSLLIRDGLNLSAQKTYIMSKKNFSIYRCLPLLHSINVNDDDAFEKQIKSLGDYEGSGSRVKIDTAVKAIIGHVRRNQHLRTPKTLNLIDDYLKKHPEIYSTMNSKQFLSSILIGQDSSFRFKKMKSVILRSEATAAKATLLKMLREDYKLIESGGVRKGELIGSVAEIEKSSHGSELLKRFCIPAVKHKINS